MDYRIRKSEIHLSFYKLSILYDVSDFSMLTSWIKQFHRYEYWISEQIPRLKLFSQYIYPFSQVFCTRMPEIN